MPKLTPAQRLAAWLKKEGKSQRELAEMLGIKQPSVSKWCTTGRPDPIYREPLERLTGIEASAWLTNAERRVLQRIGGEAA